ncbi:inositol monophosphatase family protein [Epibacterium sp. Ofav1-8]|uniref:inositol monophosphatase family protein n=1 Tax=Epibacterium sp. Ofav1-8 TaxID=2917735 RepID=UPI001EF57DE2|nr:inositol monophosphatase [Epibacterium sp. Ofav1-8]MCG7623327.1 inositol monophosphatase [Epibacterium sp. Ofav1-8]
MRLDQNTEGALIAMVRAAAQAEIMPRFRNLSAAAITEKSSTIDLVTEADVAAERHMTRRVADILPGAVVIGEEAVSADPATLARLPQAEVAVILDPIDGTWNFANGLATFGVILAVVVRGRTVFGLLYDPVMDDWVQASLGGGCWFAAPDRAPERLQVAAERSFAEATGFLPHYLFPAAEQPRLVQGMIAARRVNALCCSCHEYRMMAQGNADFIQTEGLHCWDHAAGVLAVQEAGGYAQLVDGRDYAPVISEGRLTVATGPRMRDEVCAAFDLG